MIPATYPSKLDENNTTQMVVYYLSSVSGLERWKDYIPVKETPLSSPELNSFNTNGAIYTTALSSIVGKQAWVDYIPVYEDSLATDAWTINAVGYLTTKSEVVAKALAVIASYGTDAHVYFPGIGVINGLTAGNYLDSAGTTAATVDNPVGLVLDGAGSVGSELTTNGDFSNGLTGWTLNAEATGTATVVNGALSYARVHGDYAAVYQTNKCTIGKTYRVSYDVVSKVDSAITVTIQCGRTTVFNAFIQDITLGTKIAYVVATHPDGFNISVRTNGQIAIDNVSVKEVTGIHATQGTTANKPILRRGAVNLLTYSQEISVARGYLTDPTSTLLINSGIAPDGTLTASKFSATSSNSNQYYYRVSNGLIVGTIYTYSQYFKYDTGGNGKVALTIDNKKAEFDLITGVVVSGTGVISNVGNGWYRCSISITYTGANSNYATDNRGTFTQGQGPFVWGAQLQTGSVATDYIPTTTAPASSSTGNYHWVHDSTDVLTATFPAGYESATTIDARTSGHVTLTAQNIVGSYSIGPSVDTYGRFIFRTGLTASELTTMQTFANRLAGV